MSVVVIDEFLNNPTATRAYALSLDFSVKGNYPGARTRSFANADWIPLLEKHLGGQKITWFDTHPFSYNGAFQVCTAADGDSWIHRDTTDWAGVLFLSDDDAPGAAGLTLYRHASTRALGSAGYDPKTVAALDADAPDASKWEVSSTIGNVFNRLVLFRGDQFHKSSAYFGDSKATGRLFQVFFFNTTSPPLLRWSLNVPRVLVVVFSTNRYDYLEQTLEALRRQVDFGGCFVKTLLIDDYPAARDAMRSKAIEDRFCVDIVVRHSANKGLGRTWRETWDSIRARPELGDWIFHLEDDAVFEKPVAVREVIEAFASCKKPLTQVFFKRNVCYAPEVDFIAKIEAGKVGDDLESSSIGVTQNEYFVAMASVYPRELVTRFVSEADPHEHTVRDFFGEWGMSSGMWGGRGDAPVVRHVGEVSRGLKVSEDDAAYADFAGLPRGVDYHFATGAPVSSAAKPATA